MIRRIKYNRKKWLLVAISDEGDEITMKLDLCPDAPVEYAIVKNMEKLEQVLMDEYPADPFYVEHVLTKGGAIAVVSTALYAARKNLKLNKTTSTTIGENKGCRNAT